MAGAGLTSRGDTREARSPAAISATLTSAGVGSMAGMVAGFVWGGIGGRIAMRIIFLTSSDAVRGLTSDDGFEIGRMSADTVILLIGTTIMGAIAGIFYGLLRMLLRGPRWSIAIGIGVAAAAGAGGGLIVNAEGIDFRVLDPLWLAVGLFLLIPAGWGVTVVFLTERLLQSGTVFKTLPPQINKRLGGIAGSVVGWLILGVITAIGLVDLIDDLDRLNDFARLL